MDGIEVITRRKRESELTRK